MHDGSLISEVLSTFTMYSSHNPNNSSIIVSENEASNDASSNSSNEKKEKKHKVDELPKSYTLKAPFLVALEASVSSSFAKKGARMDKMMDLLK